MNSQRMKHPLRDSGDPSLKTKWAWELLGKQENPDQFLTHGAYLKVSLLNVLKASQSGLGWLHSVGSKERPAILC